MGQLTYLLCSISMVKAPDHGGLDLFSLHGYPPQLVFQVISVSWRVHREEGGGGGSEGAREGGREGMREGGREERRWEGTFPSHSMQT